MSLVIKCIFLVKCFQKNTEQHDFDNLCLKTKTIAISVFFLPSLLDRSLTRPARQVSVTSEIFDAHLPIACIVEATNCLSELVI